jgi:sugar lactone lactonase YvrE
MLRPSILVLVCAALACGDDGGDPTGSTSEAPATTSAGPGTTGASTGDATTQASTDAPTTGEPSTTSTTGDATDPTTGPGTTDDTGTSTGDPLDCDALSDGPFAPELWLSGFGGSEDLAFDGQGRLALKRGGEVVLVAADASESAPLVGGLPQVYGTRWLADGRLLLALPQQGVVRALDEMGDLSDFADNVGGPNGIFADLDGAVWITEFGDDRVIRVDPDQTRTVIAEGDDAAAANGVVYSPELGFVYYTRYLAGEVRRVAIDGGGQPGASELVAEVPGNPDGLVLDACGNLYAVDQGNSDLYRLRREGGDHGPATWIAEFPTNVANAQFGAGEGFAPTTLYVAGNPGDVYTLALGVPGAEVPGVSP